VRNLLYRQFRAPGEEPPLHLFADLKRIARRWMDEGYLVCKGGTYPAQLLYQEIADMAGERIFLACQRGLEGDKRIKAIPDAYNPEGSSRFVNFTTSKATRYRTSPERCHVNWVVCDSDWEAEFARVAEGHPRVLAYVKNQGLGFEVPYREGAIPRKYLPDFILRIDDGRPDPLNLIIETKGYRKGNAQAKADTMHTLWVPGVNNLGSHGRWAFAEFTDVFEIEARFRDLIAEMCVAEAA
jgi:type III restriction enzyme